MKTRETAFLCAMVALTIFIGFLHFNVVPHIAWRGPDGTVELGWKSIVAAWPIWVTSGAVAATLGLSGSLQLKGSLRERRAISEADKLRALALQARKEADSAMSIAESAFAADREALKSREEEVYKLSRHAEEAIGQTQLLQAKIAELQCDADYQRKKIASLQKPRQPRKFSSHLPFK